MWKRPGRPRPLERTRSPRRTGTPAARDIDEEITFDLSSDEEGDREAKDEEVTDADLEALLQEATAEGIEEAKEEEEVLEIISETEAVEEVQLEEEKPSLMDIESIADSFEENAGCDRALDRGRNRRRARAGLGSVGSARGAGGNGAREIAVEEPSIETLTGISRSGLRRSSPRSFRMWSRGWPGRPWRAWLKE